MQRVHLPRDEPAEGAVEDEADQPEGDREDDRHHQEEVQQHTAAIEAVHLRGRHDPPKPLPRCEVCIISVWLMRFLFHKRSCCEVTGFLSILFYYN